MRDLLVMQKKDPETRPSRAHDSSDSLGKEMEVTVVDSCDGK